MPTIVHILIMAFIAICTFFIFQWIIPLIFGMIGFNIPAHIVNILSILCAAGSAWGWRYWGWKSVP